MVHMLVRYQCSIYLTDVMVESCDYGLDADPGVKGDYSPLIVSQ